MLSLHAVLPMLFWTAQYLWPAPSIYNPPQPPGPQPDYALPVYATEPAEIPPDPVIGCIFRPAEVPYDKTSLDDASRRILQITRLSRLREAQQIESLGPPSVPENRLVQPEPISIDVLRQRRTLAKTIAQHWRFFETRVYEVRMFQHRPVEAKLAAQRATAAWEALLSQLYQAGPLPDDLQDELAEVNGLVGVIRRAGI